MRYAIMISVWILFLPVLAFAQDDTLILLGSNTDVYHTSAVAGFNGHAFVADDDQGLWVIDYSVATFPTVNHYMEPALDVEIQKDLAYYVGHSTLYIRDVSNPLESEIIGSCPIGCFRGFRVHLFDTLAVAMHMAPWEYCYFDIIDISDPTDPQPLSTYNTVPPWSTAHWGDIYTKENYIYWVDREFYPEVGKIIVFDITDPTDPIPIVVDTCLPTTPYAIYIKDNYAYVALSKTDLVNHGGLMVLDVSDPYSIDSVGFFEISEASAFNVYIKGNLAYVSAHIKLPPYIEGDGIYVLDISDPANLSLATYYHTPASPRDIFVDEPYVLVADYTSLLIFEASFLELIPGDVNGDSEVNLGDVVFLISYLYRGGPAPDPVERGDVNGDCVVDLGDVVYLISYLYRGGPAPQNGCGY